MTRRQWAKATSWATVSAVAVALTAAGACSVGSEKPPTKSVEDGRLAVASFALSPDCAACAENAALGACAAEAEACLLDPACADVGACVQACAPADPLCIADCLQLASAALDAIASCVVCDECPLECAGAWDCGGGAGGSGSGVGGSWGAGGGWGVGGGGVGGSGTSGGSGGGGPGGSCDGSGCCDACLECAVIGPCQAIFEACLMSGDPACEDEVVACALCQECPIDCAEEAEWECF